MSELAWKEAIDANFDNDGLPSFDVMAGHVRSAFQHTDLLSKSRVSRAFSESYAPFNLEEDVFREKIAELLDRLVAIGDLVTIKTGAGDAFLLTPGRIVDIGDGRTVFLGAGIADSSFSTGLVRETATDALSDATDYPALTLADEIGMSECRQMLVQLGGKDAKDGVAASLFKQAAGLASSGERLAISDKTTLRVLGGRGTFFGNGRGKSLEGRWRIPEEKGCFCAVRKTATGWLYCLVNVLESEGRVWDATTVDLWRWAAIGQTLSLGDPVFQYRDGVIQFFVPPPRQVNRILALVGTSIAPWRWAANQAAVKFLERFLECASQ